MTKLFSMVLKSLCYQIVFSSLRLGFRTYKIQIIDFFFPFIFERSLSKGAFGKLLYIYSHTPPCDVALRHTPSENQR